MLPHVDWSSAATCEDGTGMLSGPNSDFDVRVTFLLRQALGIVDSGEDNIGRLSLGGAS